MLRRREEVHTSQRLELLRPSNRQPDGVRGRRRRTGRRALGGCEGRHRRGRGRRRKPVHRRCHVVLFAEAPRPEPGRVLPPA